jgi:hypothetical protein
MGGLQLVLQDRGDYARFLLTQGQADEAEPLLEMVPPIRPVWLTWDLPMQQRDRSSACN